MGALVLDDVCFSYSDDLDLFTRRRRAAGEGEDLVLKHLSLTVEDGQFLCLVGHSGCGKTTLLRCAKPELAPVGERAGAVLLGGEPLAAGGREPRIGYVSQDADNQIVCDKVWHELAFGLENLGTPPDDMRRRVAEVAHFFGMEPWFRRSAEELSGGQKALVCLASVLVMQPSVLLLDEPTAQLDPVAQKSFLHALFRLNRELGERDKAVAQSEEMMRLAPTTARGAIELSLDYTDVGEDYAGSADALIRGLKTALMPIDVGFMYYRLGYALWKTNSHKAGLACYAMVLSMPEGPFHDRSRDEANQLLAEMGEEELPDRDRAEQTLRAAGIPVAPPLALLEQLAKVAIMLVDAGFPLAADEAVWLLGIMQPADVLPALRRSLRWGAAGITPDSDE